MGTISPIGYYIVVVFRRMSGRVGMCDVFFRVGEVFALEEMFCWIGEVMG
jgi:hypothetical protein